MEQFNENIEQILEWIKLDDLKSLKAYLRELEPAVIANLMETLKEEPR